MKVKKKQFWSSSEHRYFFSILKQKWSLNTAHIKFLVIWHTRGLKRAVTVAIMCRLDKPAPKVNTDIRLIYIYMRACVCVCVCVCNWRPRKQIRCSRRKTCNSVSLCSLAMSLEFKRLKGPAVAIMSDTSAVAQDVSPYFVPVLLQPYVMSFYGRTKALYCYLLSSSVLINESLPTSFSLVNGCTWTHQPLCTTRFSITKSYVLPTQLYLCVLCGSDNKQRLFPYTTLTDWFV